MAQLNDLLVLGKASIADSLKLTKLNVPTSSNSTTFGPGTSGQVLKSNGTSVYWSNDTNTDTKVSQTRSTATNWRPLLMHYTNTSQGTDPGAATNQTYYNESLSVQPSTGKIYTAGGMQSNGNIFVKGSNPYIAFQNSSGTTKGYVQYIESSDIYALGASSTNSLQVGATGSVSIPSGQAITPREDATGSVGTSDFEWATAYIRNLRSGSNLILDSAASTSIIFRRNTSEVARFNTSGNFVLSGAISSSKASSTWLNSANGASAINLTGSGYTGWIAGNSKNGRLVISSYSSNDDKLYFSYMKNDTITAGTNSMDAQMTWDGSTNTLTAATFKGALSGNAATASKLNPGAKINGTTFTGESDITTANWGTTRTVTIGDTAKSVNGSANYAWSASAIGYRHEWSATVKGATWSRLCLVKAGTSTVGCKFILNIGATRGNVVYNDTFIVTAHHSANGKIIKLAGHNYSSGYQVRLLANSTGDCYVELYDNCQSATSSTTQTVYCRLIPIFCGAITKYTDFTTGATLPSGYTVKQTMTIDNTDMQGTITGTLNGNASSATKASYVLDYNNSTPVYFGYSTSGLESCSWLGAWDATTSGQYRLRAISPSKLSVSYANSAGSASSATVAGKISDLTENDLASSSTTWRRIWMSYSNNVTGRPAYDDRFAIQTSTGTLKAPTFQGNLSGNATTATTATNASNADKLDNYHATSFMGLTETWLDASALNTSTYYPVTVTIPYDGLRRIKLAVQLNSGTKPSWSTHNNGFTSNIDVEIIAGGWGTVTPYRYLVYQDDFSFTTDADTKPAYFAGQLRESSNAVFYVRGGGKYRFIADWRSAAITLHTAAATFSGNREIKPVTNTTTFHDGSLTNIKTNITGNATTATSATKATQDGSGNVITSTYLKLSGGTMSGDISYTKGSYTSIPLQVLDDGTTYGHTLLVGAGGTTYIGAGEAASTLYNTKLKTKSTETLILGADGNIQFYPGADNATTTNGITIDTSKNFYPQTTNTGSVGTSTYVWKSMYATTFYGALSGNASTATALTSNAGGTTTPIYFTGGKPVACNMAASGDWWGALPQIGTDGVMEIGKYIDFHNTDTETSDYSYRITTDANTLTGSASIKATAALIAGTTLTVGTTSLLKGVVTLGAYTDNSTKVSGGIAVHDLRGVTPVPAMFGEKRVNFYFDQADGSRWSTIMHMHGWTAGGYASGEIAVNAHTDTTAVGTLKYRAGKDGTWSSWHSALLVDDSTGRLAQKLQFNSTSLSESSSANGLDYVCGITAFDSGGELQWKAISALKVGYATSAGSAAKLGSSNVGTADRPIYLKAGVATQTTYRMAGTNAAATTALSIANDLPTGIWYVNGTSDILSQSDGVCIANQYNANWISEIYQDYRTGQLAIRGKNNGTWQAWRKVLDSTNWTSVVDGRYLKLSGGTMSGHIYLGGSNASSSTGNTTQIVFGTSSTNHVALSANNNALVINPTTASTTNQIVLYLDSPSVIPSGIKTNVIHAPTSSGGTTYGPGTSGYVLKSNGTTVYWAADANTNTKVTQTSNASTSWRSILTHYSATTQGTAPANTTNIVYYTGNASIQPSTGKIFTAGGIVTSKASGTWLASANGESAINLTGTSYTGWIAGNSKNGRLIISSYPSNDDNLYFGYMSNGFISEGLNYFSTKMTWNGSANLLTVGNIDATTYSKAGFFITSNYGEDAPDETTQGHSVVGALYFQLI